MLLAQLTVVSVGISLQRLRLLVLCIDIHVLDRQQCVVVAVLSGGIQLSSSGIQLSSDKLWLLSATATLLKPWVMLKVDSLMMDCALHLSVESIPWAVLQSAVLPLH